MLDFDLARIYGYSTKRFNEQVKNNKEKFGEDFMFQLNDIETDLILRSKKSTSSWGGTRKSPYAFTEKGIYMLMTVLRGELAIQQSKTLIRLFEKMKNYIVSSNSLNTINELLKPLCKRHAFSYSLIRLNACAPKNRHMHFRMNVIRVRARITYD